MKLTREGKRFLLATALIAVAAFNTGNNLIYLILSLMFSFIASSYGILKMNLSGLLLEVLVSGPVFAGEPARAELLIYNRKKIPAYSLNLSAADVADKIYCSHVPPRGSVKKEMTVMFNKRGLYGYRDFFIQSGFPFILFQKSIAVEVSGNVLVYPQLLDIDGLIDDITAHEDHGERAVRNSGDDVSALREYQYGDDLRDIHWKASARWSSLIVKEYAGHLSRRITIIMDNSMPRQDEQHFEKAVAVAASLTNYYIGRGYLVRLLSCQKVVPFGSGQGHLFSILDILALMCEEECGDDSLMSSPESFFVTVLRSPHSTPALQAGAGGMVVYADTVKSITAILAVTGCMSLLMTGELNLMMCMGGLTLFPGYCRFLNNYPQASKRAGAVLAQAALLVFLADAVFITGDIFLAVAHMTITFQGIKSFDLKEPWDHLQVYFMSLLQLIIASELTRALMFGVIFVAFMMLLVTAMVLSHFLKEGALGRVRLRRPVIAIVALTMVCTTFFFILLPRTPQRFIGKSHYRGIKTIGFSDTVDFGSFGDIKMDQTIVMRIELKRAVPPPYYWRGKSMDYFDGISWRNTTKKKNLMAKRADEFLFSRYDRNTAVVQEVFLEPIDTDAVFGLARIAAVNADAFSLIIDDDMDISIPGRYSKRERYTVYSDPAGFYPCKREAKYLQLPAGMSRIRRLAENVTERNDDDATKALQIEGYLKKNYAYSLSTSPPPAGMSVIEDFLFHSRRGYCEHYATSMVMLLRSVNIPARIVNGFYGGERNEYGNYLMLRQSDAHAWVEALIGNTWRRFDPTPAVTLQGPRTIALLLDALRMQWTRYVIGFSFYDQKEILKKITLPLRLREMPQVPFKALGSHLPLLLAGIIICLIIAAVSRYRRRKYGFVTALYLEFRALLKKKGFQLKDSMTTGDIRDMTGRSSIAGAVREFVHLYEWHRFGERTMTDMERNQYEQLLEQIKRLKQ